MVIGGGTGGLSVASRLRRAGQSDVGVIEPSTGHYYQPLWTLVGAGLVSAESTRRPEVGCIPRGVHWIRDAVAEIDAARNLVLTRGGAAVGYDFLVICPGIQIGWHKVSGLAEALQPPFVSSNYDYALAPKTWEMIRSFRGGNALFTNPGTPIIVTAHNRMLLAEFDYALKPAPSIPFLNLQKERYDMFLLKRYGLPFMSWDLMLKGLA